MVARCCCCSWVFASTISCRFSSARHGIKRGRRRPRCLPKAGTSHRGAELDCICLRSWGWTVGPPKHTMLPQSLATTMNDDDVESHKTSKPEVLPDLSYDDYSFRSYHVMQMHCFADRMIRDGELCCSNSFSTLCPCIPSSLCSSCRPCCASAGRCRTTVWCCCSCLFR